MVTGRPRGGCSPHHPASESVLERVAPVVRRLVEQALGRDAEFDDITHDVFVRILQGLCGLRNSEYLEEWAERITVNAVSDTLRKRGYRRMVCWDPQRDPDLLVTDTDFDSQLVAREVARLISRLPEGEQALLQRRWFGRSTVDEIAQQAECSPRTVKRRMERARARFARLVQNDAEVSSWLQEHQRNGVDDLFRSAP